MSISSVTMSAFATLGRTCLMPNAPSYRIGRGVHARAPMMRSNQSFHVCRLNKQHMASIAVGLGIITLLLVIFAYHGGHGIGSWFYSLLVVISGLTFVIFGPLLLCRFLMHAYYRQIESRAIRLQSDVGNQTTPNGDGARPHVYACIIIAPEEITSSFGTISRLSDLPTYEEAVLHNVTGKHQQLANNFSSTMQQPIVATKVESFNADATCSIEEDVSALCQPSVDCSNVVSPCVESVYESRRSESLIKEDSPPPSYSDALCVFERYNRQQEAMVLNSQNSATTIDIENDTNANGLPLPILATNFSL